MEGIYRRLAQHLDNLPGGFPATESGVEIRILKRLFSPEEAETAAALTLLLETPEQIAARTGADTKALAPRLDAMSRKGLILRSGRGGETRYMAAQFVVGIWEFHVNDLDEGLIRDFNEYVPHLMESQMTHRTQQLRVIPISRSISAEMNIMPYEEAETIIRSQSKIVVAPCICRKEHAMVGKGCDKPLEVCLTFAGGAHFYEENNIGRTIDQQEALEILQKGVDAGLVLQPGNSQKPVNICMCCGCCCQILKNLKNTDKPASVANTNYYAVVDEERCTVCGVCRERCQMDAIVLEDAARVDRDRCIGCGVCVPTCEFDAISLQRKPPDESWVPPKSIVETYITIARERGKLA